MLKATLLPMSRFRNEYRIPFRQTPCWLTQDNIFLGRPLKRPSLLPFLSYTPGDNQTQQQGFISRAVGTRISFRTLQDTHNPLAERECDKLKLLPHPPTGRVSITISLGAIKASLTRLRNGVFYKFWYDATEAGAYDQIGVTLPRYCC